MIWVGARTFPALIAAFKSCGTGGGLKSGMGTITPSSTRCSYVFLINGSKLSKDVGTKAPASWRALFFAWADSESPPLFAPYRHNFDFYIVQNLQARIVAQNNKLLFGSNISWSSWSREEYENLQHDQIEPPIWIAVHMYRWPMQPLVLLPCPASKLLQESIHLDPQAHQVPPPFWSESSSLFTNMPNYPKYPNHFRIPRIPLISPNSQNHLVFRS